MKFIHCSDLHLDAAMTSKLSPEAAKQRREELLAAFSRLAGTAKREGVAAVIMAGDVFDVRSVRKRTMKFFTETVAECAGVDFLVLCGNHDESVFDGLDLPANLKLFGSGWTYYDYGNVTVGGAGVCSEPPSFDPERVNIAVLHGEDGKDFSFSELAGKNIDYLALGHFHSFSEKPLDKRGTACYSGCLEGRGFDETGEKGFVMLDVEGGKIGRKFVPFASRKVVEVRADLTGASDLAGQKKAISDALSGCDARDLVRLTVTGGYELGREKFYNIIIDELKGGFFYLEYADASKLIIKPEDYMNDISLKGEFIRLVMKNVRDAEERDDIISFGIRALRGDDLG